MAPEKTAETSGLANSESTEKAAFSASMIHNADTIRRLVRMQANTFNLKQKYIWAGCGISVIILGFFAALGQILSTICIFVGCWALVSINLPTRMRADRIIGTMKGVFPSTRYAFCPEEAVLTSDGNTSTVSYHAIIRLIDDGDYLYFYVSRQSAYMVSKKSVSGGVDQLKEMISHQAKLKWTKPFRCKRFSLRSYLESRRNTHRI